VRRRETWKGGADVEGAVRHLRLHVGGRRRLDGHGRSGQVQLALVTLLQTILTFQEKPMKQGKVLLGIHAGTSAPCRVRAGDI
jgi:hypothetical protein